MGQSTPGTTRTPRFTTCSGISRKWPNSRTSRDPQEETLRSRAAAEAINVASAREKSIRHGHPSTLHLWWARRPLAAARAVIFAQMFDDPPR
ncbi:DUF1156 domain-containing protein [Accumulibacter sp.]|uniref:DUF1156 domain-containing protein n=1 Tax=Accumulibacter sp. TaxID=2053492 RepID=UPI00258DD63A|nr:DUF1156 domain-containing protein [Accumulibacter sp.]